jgi:hypothetical protein
MVRAELGGLQRAEAGVCSIKRSLNMAPAATLEALLHCSLFHFVAIFSILLLLSHIGPYIFLRTQYVFFLKSKRPDLISYNKTVG